MRKKFCIVLVLTILIQLFATIGTFSVVATQSKTENFSRAYTLTGDKKNDIVAVAQAQYLKLKKDLGYTENWCADFVCDCAKLANISGFPFTGGVSDLKSQLLSWGGTWYSYSSSYTPQKGDIVFLTRDGGYNHVGIVTADGFNSNGTVNTIEGNTGMGDYSSSYGVNVKKRAPKPTTLNGSTMYVLGYVSWSVGYEVHVHSCVEKSEAQHPHRVYEECVFCGDIEYTGETVTVDTCSSCYPKPGVCTIEASDTNVSNGQTITITWSAASNATSYNLKYVLNDEYYTVKQGITARSYNFTFSEEGTYYFYVDSVNASGYTQSNLVKIEVGRRGVDYKWTYKESVNGAEKKSLYAGEKVYFEFDLVDKVTGKPYNEYAKYPYTVSIHLKNADGEVLYSKKLEDTDHYGFSVTLSGAGWYGLQTAVDCSVQWTLIAGHSSILVNKSQNAKTPSAPKIKSKTSNSVTLEKVQGCEYSKDGKTWQSSNVFSGLNAKTSYTFYQRYKETSTTLASKTSAGLTAITGNSVKITTQPKTAYAKMGSTVTTSVKATGDGLKYTWYVCDDGDAIYYKSSINTATYAIKMTALKSNRKVYCVVTDKYGNQVRSNTVRLRAKAAITTQPKTAYAKMGSTVKTSVKATGDGLKYTWYVCDDGDAIYYKSSINTATYAIKMTALKTNRKVYCVVTDKYGNKVRSTTVRLRAKAAITTQPKNTYAKMGATAKVSVKATGDGLKYVWYVKNAGSSKYTKSSVTKSTYSVKMSSKTNGRKLICYVYDKYGNKVQSNTVVIKKK